MHLPIVTKTSIKLKFMQKANALLVPITSCGLVIGMEKKMTEFIMHNLINTQHEIFSRADNSEKLKSKSSGFLLHDLLSRYGQMTSNLITSSVI